MTRPDLNPTPAPTRPAYDLTTAAADYPEFHGPPRQTLLICTHPRSGSTLLGETIHAVGGLGCPLEYFHRGFRPAFARRWQAPDLDSYVQAVHRFRTDRTGVLSAKLFWADVRDIIRERDQALADRLAGGRPATTAQNRRILSSLSEIFPDPTFVHLRRDDRVRQSVSALVADQTRRWRSLPAVRTDGSRAEAVVSYDYQRILGQIMWADLCEAQWQSFFSANRIRPLEVTYEQLVAPGRHGLGELLDALGYTGPLPESRLIRQADARSEALVLRFLIEHQESSLACTRRSTEVDSLTGDKCKETLYGNAGTGTARSEPDRTRRAS